MAKQIYQIQIALKGSKPKIWRRVLVPSDLPVPDFHKIIQTTMGWTNSHLHHFAKGNQYYAPPAPEDDLWFESNDIDYTKMKINELLQSEKDKIEYEYDFGDGWRHNIVLEKILPYDETKTYPVCVAGKRNCPPEDCGGIWGYEAMLEALKHPNPESEDYQYYIELVGDNFDPEDFDKEIVNDLYTEEDYGCLDIF